MTTIKKVITVIVIAIVLWVGYKVIFGNADKEQPAIIPETPKKTNMMTLPCTTDDCLKGA